MKNKLRLASFPHLLVPEGVVMGNKNINIDEALAKEGITNITSLDTLKVNSISKSVAQKICGAFPNYGLDYKNLFMELSRLNMYSATMPDNLSQAKYYYKNSSIYFNKNADFNNLDCFAVHECLHYLQSVKGANGKLTRLGLCDFSKSSKPGIALNEAAVQLITTKCVGSELDTVKYYGIEISTPSPSYYPLECALVNQMAYVTGLGTLFESTLNSNNDFKNKFIELTSKNTYYTIELNLDYLMYLEDSLSDLYSKLEEDISDKQINKINEKITKTKEKIVTVFMGIQQLIYTTYFNNYFKTLENKVDIENFRTSLYKFAEFIGVTETNTDFNEFYIELMAKVEKKYESALNPSMYLTPVKNNFVSTLFRKLRTLVVGNTKAVEKYTNIE